VLENDSRPREQRVASSVLINRMCDRWHRVSEGALIQKPAARLHTELVVR
jgi:hypothetical protein